MTLRDKLNASLKDAMKAKEAERLSTLRLINAAIKDRDIAARGNGNPDGISDDGILGLLQTMIKQRNESAKMYRDGDRPEDAVRHAHVVAYAAPGVVAHEARQRREAADAHHHQVPGLPGADGDGGQRCGARPLCLEGGALQEQRTKLCGAVWADE